jgi:hypothetical protein
VLQHLLLGLSGYVRTWAQARGVEVGRCYSVLFC